MFYNTPGVYVEEVALFPPSVVAVATAVPAFIGYTQRTTAPDGQSLLNRPVRMTSFLDFTTLFGAGYNPASYTIQLNPGAGFNIVSVTPVNNRRYYLHDILRHFYDNGGGPCYVVSVGNYTSAIAYGNATTGLRGGLAAVEKVDEPTLIAIPDAVGLRLANGNTDFVQLGTLHADIIEQCNRLQDRFGLLDLAEGYLAPDAATTPVAQFRNQVGTENLKYAAAYYPWLCSTYVPEVHFTQFIFQDNAALPNAIPDATIDTLANDPAIDGLVTRLRTALADEQNVFSKVTQVGLTRANYHPLSTHFETLQNAVFAESTAALVRPAFQAFMQFVRQLALALEDIENDPGIPAELQSVLTTLEADTALRAQLTTLIAYEKNAGVMGSIALARTVNTVNNDYASLDTQGWIGGVAVNTIAADATDFTNGGGNTVAQTAHAAANSTLLRTAFDAVAEAYTALVDVVLFRTNQAEANLFSTHPFFIALTERVRKEMTLLPPTGAVAGVYAATDRTRGVWKAPANVSLRAVVAPAYKLTDLEQSTLNVHETGKSVNAIRAFTGRGILVWGARTLAGNDNEWRYVNVRRFFIMVEESVKKATEPFVFEPNEAKTWVRVRAMIENFLTLQWRQGALAGATPREAFFVKVGLGETMTAQDILEGRMIVEIGMAAVRPAEFIILRFSHKMQES